MNDDPVPRITLLIVLAVIAWVLPKAIIVPQRYRHGVSLTEYRCAYRSARWFGWEPGVLATWLLRLAIIAYGVWFAFSDLLVP